MRYVGENLRVLSQSVLALCVFLILSACKSSSNGSASPGGNPPSETTTTITTSSATNTSTNSAISNADTSGPTATANPASGSVILNNRALVIVFSESVKTASLNLSGTLASESNGGIWSSTNRDNDTLTVSPTSNWSTGSGKTLSIDVDDLSDNAGTTVSLTYTVTSAIVYVHPSGNDANSGSADAPYLTLQTAIDDLYTHYSGGAVRIAQGTYWVSSSVQLKAGVSLYGGYKSDNWNVRDTSLYVSTLRDSRTSGGNNSTPISTVSLSSGMGSLIVDGLTIRGADADYSAAIITSSAYAYTFQNNVIVGGAAANQSFGIKTVNDVVSNAVFDSNTISGGSGLYSYAAYVAGSGTYQSNTFNAGSGTSNFGLYLNSATGISVTGNTINGGSGTTSHGLYTNVTNATISGNTISGGTGTTNSYGVYITSGTSPYPTLTENVIHGGTSATTRGMYVVSANATISRNKIHGGTATLSSHGAYLNSTTSNFVNNQVYGGNSSDVSYGLFLINPSDHRVRNNTVNGGIGGTGGGATNASYGLYLSSSASPAIENNIFSTAGGTNRYCMHDSFVTGTLSLKNNDFYNCPKTLLYMSDSSCSGNHDGDSQNTTCDIDDINGVSGFSGNVNSDPQFVDIDGADNDLSTLSENDWRLQNATPASVRTGGLDGVVQSFGFSVDYLGTTRTGSSGTGWSIGAFEKD